MIDTNKSEEDPERVKIIAETRAWNVQQSCMLQWLGPDYKNRILFNDYRDKKICVRNFEPKYNDGKSDSSSGIYRII